MAWSFEELVSRGLVIFQLVLQQVQYISLLNQLDINWPDGFRNSYKDMEVININLKQYVADVQLPEISYRGLFTVISIMMPIITAVLIMVIFQPFLVVILWGTMTFGVVALVAGLVGRYLSSVALDVSTDTSLSYIIAGAVMIGVSFCFLVIIKCLQVDLRRKQIEADLIKFHRGRTMRHMVSTVFLIIVGLTLSSNLNFGFQDVLKSTTVNIWVYVGYVFLVIGAINGLYFIACLFRSGRRFQLVLGGFINRNGLMLLLVLIGSTFIPVLTYALQMMMCKTYTCPTGYAFNPHAYRPVGSYDTSSERYCDPCTFQNTAVCPLNMSSSVCPAFASRRSWAYPDTACDDNAAGLFRFAAATAIAAFGLSIPAMYFVVIRLLAYKMKSVHYPGEECDIEPVQWSKRITLVRPVASSLYEAFSESTRFFVLVSIGERVLIMVILVIIAPFTEYAVAGVFTVFVVYFLIMVFSRPFLHGLELGLGIGTSLAMVFNGSMALYIWKAGDGGSGYTLFGIFIAFNVVVPLAAAAIGHKKVAPLPTAADLKSSLSHNLRKGYEEHEVDLDVSVGKKHMSPFFMVTGVFFIIAFGACVLGMLRTPDTKWLVSTSALYQTNTYTLAGYSDWNTMASTCCCISSANPSEDFSVEERWICPNGKVLERGRVNRANDGTLSLRAVCGKAPLDSRCTITTSSKGVPSMSCPDTVIDTYVPSQMSSVAYQLYW